VKTTTTTTTCVSNKLAGTASRDQTDDTK